MVRSTLREATLLLLASLTLVALICGGQVKARHIDLFEAENPEGSFGEGDESPEQDGSIGGPIEGSRASLGAERMGKGYGDPDTFSDRPEGLVDPLDHEGRRKTSDSERKYRTGHSSLESINSDGESKGNSKGDSRASIDLQDKSDDKQMPEVVIKIQGDAKTTVKPSGEVVTIAPAGPASVATVEAARKLGGHVVKGGKVEITLKPGHNIKALNMTAVKNLPHDKNNVVLVSEKQFKKITHSSSSNSTSHKSEIKTQEDSAGGSHGSSSASSNSPKHAGSASASHNSGSHNSGSHSSGSHSSGSHSSGSHSSGSHSSGSHSSGSHGAGSSSSHKADSSNSSSHSSELDDSSEEEEEGEVEQVAHAKGGSHPSTKLESHSGAHAANASHSSASNSSLHNSGSSSSHNKATGKETHLGGATKHPTGKAKVLTTEKPLGGHSSSTHKPATATTRAPAVKTTHKPAAKTTAKAALGHTNKLLATSHKPDSAAKTTHKPTVGTTHKPTAKTTHKPTAKTTHKPTSRPTTKTTLKPIAKTTHKPTLKPETKTTLKPNGAVKTSASDKAPHSSGGKEAGSHAAGVHSGVREKLQPYSPRLKVATSGGCPFAARPDCQCNYKEMKDTDKMLAVVITEKGGFKGRRLNNKAVLDILGNKLSGAQVAELRAHKTVSVSANNTYVLPAGHYYFPHPVRFAGFTSP